MLTAIHSIINQYVQTVSTTYNIPIADLENLMNNNNNNHHGAPQVVLPQVVLPPQVAPPPPQEICSYVYLRGQKAGQGCPLKKKVGSSFCSQHTKKPKEAKAAEEPTIEVTANEPPKKPNPILRMNKVINKWWHPESGLVFKSSEEKIVIGIYKDDTIHDLSEEDVKTCIAFKFRYVYNKRKLEDTRSEQEDDDEPEPVIKKAKKSINEAFIEVNQQAKNVEVLIKEMFNGPPVDEYGGAEESKSNYESSQHDEEDEVEEEEELLEEEDD
jgi:hypothetical protein